MNSFHLERIHSNMEWIYSILERIRSRCFWNLISSPLLKIQGLLCEFIAEGIIFLAFLIKKLLTFMMTLEITLEWFHSNMEWIHSSLISYDSRMEWIYSKVKKLLEQPKNENALLNVIKWCYGIHVMANLVSMTFKSVFLFFGCSNHFLFWNEFIPFWNHMKLGWNEFIP